MIGKNSESWLATTGFGGTEHRPPELIIQDELHLIAGALGSVAVDLNQLIEDVQEIFIEELHSYNVQLKHTQLPIVHADRVLLFQVFQNLIQNAIKYRRADTPLEIDISYSASDSDYCIAVADNGSGFDVSQKDKVFQMFGRLHSEEVSGTGAGLAICSKIVNLHGGHLDADAEPGKGATFYVFLPKHPAQKKLAF